MVTQVTQENFTSILDDIMHGAADMHVHFGPDVRPENLLLARRLDALGTAQDADRAGMAAIVLKAHYWPTGALAQVLQPLVSNVRLFGMMVLNYQCGGLNAFAAEVGARLDCKIVMAPTSHTRQAVARAREQDRPLFGVRPDQDGISLLDDRGRLVPEMEEILDIAQQYHQVVASGHLEPPEDRALVEAAHRRGLRTILTHLPPDQSLLDERKWMLDHGAVVEWGWNMLRPSQTPDFAAMIEQARALGVDRCCMTTDPGQAMKPPPSETFRMFAGQLLYHGMSPEEVKTMAQRVPAELLGLDKR